jgi:hypothetical protein
MSDYIGAGAGTTLSDHVQAGKNINIAKNSGGNTIGVLKGVDDKFIYVQTNANPATVNAVPYSNVFDFTIT